MLSEIDTMFLNIDRNVNEIIDRMTVQQTLLNTLQTDAVLLLTMNHKLIILKKDKSHLDLLKLNETNSATK